jgi:hypothetical protein
MERAVKAVHLAERREALAELRGVVGTGVRPLNECEAAALQHVYGKGSMTAKELAKCSDQGVRVALLPGVVGAWWLRGGN